MPLFILRNEECTREEFVAYWSQGYSYLLEELYLINIGAERTRESVLSLYKWKNGKNLSQRKLQSIEENYFAQLEAPGLNTIYEGIQRFNALNGGPIWDIFWLHINNPDLFPIFDQHTFRAYYFIEYGEIRELPEGRTQIRDIYFNYYIPFFNEFAGVDQRMVDKALFTFGRFLKKYPFLFA